MTDPSASKPNPDQYGIVQNSLRRRVKLAKKHALMTLSFENTRRLVKNAAHDWTSTSPLRVNVQLSYRRRTQDLYIISYRALSSSADAKSEAFKDALSSAYKTLQSYFSTEAGDAAEENTEIDPKLFSTSLEQNSVNLSYTFTSSKRLSVQIVSQLVAAAAGGLCAAHEVKGLGFGSFNITRCIWSCR